MTRKPFRSAARAVGAVRELPRAEAILLVNTLVSCIGFGLYTTVSVLYYTRFADVTAVQLGLALSATASLWIVAAHPVGRLVDRFGARESTIGFGAAQGLLLGCIPFVRGFTALIVFLAVLGVVERGTSVSREALIATVVDDERRVVTAARSRSLANLGIAVGGALAGIALAFDTRTAFVVLLSAYAVTTLITSAVSTLYPRVPARGPRSAEQRARGGLFRDPPFLAVAMLTGLISLYDTVVVVGLPLWIAHGTDAPPSLFAAVLILNTVLVVWLQVRAARNTDSVPGARRALVQAGLTLAAACLIFGVAGLVPGAVAAAAVVVAGVLVITGGELRAAAADWALRYELADPEAQGEYGAIHSVGSTVRAVVGPTLVTVLVTHGDLAGWLALAALFVLLAAATRPVVGWAERTRPATATVTEGPALREEVEEQLMDETDPALPETLR